MIIKIENQFLSFVNYKNYMFFFVFVLPFSYFGSQMGLLTGILTVSWIYYFRINTKKVLFKLKQLFTISRLLLMVLFLVYASLNYFWSENKDDFFSVLKSYKYFFFIIPIFYTSLNKHNALKSLLILGISFGLFSFFCILIYLGLLSWPESSMDNPKFLFNNMIAGAYATLGTFIMYYFFSITNTKEKWIYLLFSTISVISLFINNSRSAQVAFIITLLGLFFINYKSFKQNKRYILLTVLIITTITTLIINDRNLINRYKTAYKQIITYNSESNYASSSGQRIKMYEIGLILFSKNPIIGVGAGDFKDTFHRYILEKNIKLANLFNTLHNIYIEYLLKFGLIGFFLFVGALLNLFINLLYNHKYKYIGFIILQPILILFCFDSILDFKPFNNVFILIFTLLSILSIKEKKINSFFS